MQTRVGDRPSHRTKSPGHLPPADEIKQNQASVVFCTIWISTWNCEI